MHIVWTWKSSINFGHTCNQTFRNPWAIYTVSTNYMLRCVETFFFNDQHDLTKIKWIHNDSNYTRMLNKTIHIDTKDNEKIGLRPY